MLWSSGRLPNDSGNSVNDKHLPKYIFLSLTNSPIHGGSALSWLQPRKLKTFRPVMARICSGTSVANTTLLIEQVVNVLGSATQSRAAISVVNSGQLLKDT